MYEHRSEGEADQEGEHSFYVEKAAEILLRFDFPMSNIWKGMGNWSVSKVLAMYERQLENLLYKDRDKPETEILLRLNFQS